MVQLKSLSHGKIPIMISHGAWHIFDYHWEWEDVWVQKKKVAVIDEDCEVCSPSQVEKDLVIGIIRSDSFPEVQGKISSIKRMRDVLNPKWRIHEWFILWEPVKKWKKIRLLPLEPGEGLARLELDIIVQLLHNIIILYILYFWFGRSVKSVSYI